MKLKKEHKALVLALISYQNYLYDSMKVINKASNEFDKHAKVIMRGLR
jgi:hypothetical protein